MTVIGDVTTDTFEEEVVQSERPVLIDFWGPQCNPCLALSPHVEALAERYNQKVKVIKIDASKNRRLCLRLKVIGLPMILLYANGKEIGRISGSNLKPLDIEELLKSVIES